MLIPHNTIVAVADGAKFLLFKNAGNETRIRLETAHAEEREHGSASFRATDEPGRTFSSAGTGDARSAYEQTDFQQEAETLLAAQAVDLLNRLAVEGWLKRLVIVAAPKTLGAMRPHYHSKLKAALQREIAKDLAHATTPEIEALLEKWQTNSDASDASV
ncbi:MAG: host attachment family protein [Sphingomonadaceae bacterium]|nr:host attachment family protein [Sphingomonadaceae bacterium]